MKKFYAVRIGKTPGLYNTWDDCLKQVHGFKGAVYKSFKTEIEADAFINGHGSEANPTMVSKGPKRKIPNQESSKCTKTKQRRLDCDKKDSNITLISAEQKKVALVNRKKISDKYPELLFDTEDGDRVVVYTDGSCKYSATGDRVAGYGVYWAANSSLNAAEKFIGEQTNNRAEIAAVIRAVEDAHKSGIQKLLVRTDSKFTIMCMTEWVEGWKVKKNPWTIGDGTDVKCRDVLERLDNVIRETGVDVKWSHVYGHRGDTGNTAADRLANEGADKWTKDQ